VNEVISFDTDLIGSYGICIDISRSWWIGPDKSRPDMIYTMQHGVEHICHNKEMLRPGITIPELTAGTHVLDAQFQKQKYGCLMNGVGFCDEWHLVSCPDKAQAGAFDYPLEAALEAGMVLCVEALVSPEGGDFSIKLEDQVLITEDGSENLTTYPYDQALMGM
jgi:Xaa-Pro aminopeptidase